MRKQAVQNTEKNNPCYGCRALVKVVGPKDDGLEKHGYHRAPGDRLELLLKVAAKGEFLAESGGERHRHPHQALQHPLRKKPLRRIGGVAEQMEALNAYP